MLSASNNDVAAFEAVAARCSAAIAVTGIDGSLDYGTLNDQPGPGRSADRRART